MLPAQVRALSTPSRPGLRAGQALEGSGLPNSPRFLGGQHPRSVQAGVPDASTSPDDGMHWRDPVNCLLPDALGDVCLGAPSVTQRPSMPKCKAVVFIKQADVVP